MGCTSKTFSGSSRRPLQYRLRAKVTVDVYDSQKQKTKKYKDDDDLSFLNVRKGTRAPAPVPIQVPIRAPPKTIVVGGIPIMPTSTNRGIVNPTPNLTPIAQLAGAPASVAGAATAVRVMGSDTATCAAGFTCLNNGWGIKPDGQKGLQIVDTSGRPVTCNDQTCTMNSGKVIARPNSIDPNFTVVLPPP